MRKRIGSLIALGLVLQACALIGSPPASATTAVMTPGEVKVNDDTTLLLSSDYEVVGPTVTVETDDLGPIGPQMPVDDVSPVAAADVGTITNRYCRRVTDTLEYHWRSTDHVAFYFRMTKDWCWNSITHKIVSVSTTPSGHVYGWASPAWQYEGVTDSNDFYYQYFSGISQSGHYSYRAGKFTAHCGPFYCGSRNPEIIVRAHGDGTFSHWEKG